jgi:O-antigen/teichoic acid export membrane protein
MSSAASGSGLGRRAALAIGASLAASTAARMVTVLVTFVLARLLLPLDFGIASIGLLVVMLLLPLTDIGMAQALIRAEQEELARRARTAFWLVLLLGLVLYALIFVTAGWVALFYNQPQIAPMLRAIAVALPVYALSRIPSALLERDLSFGSRGIPDIVASFGYGGVAVVLAAMHFGFWSIVIAFIARSTIQSVGLFLVTRWRPAIGFEPEVAQELIVYARFLMGGALLRLAYTNVDNAVVGKALGMAALGFYSMAYNLGNLVAVQLSEPIGKVLFPLYRRMLPDRKRVFSAALLMLHYISLFISPLTLVGIAAAPSVVPLILGTRWLPVTVSFQILLVYGWARTIAPVHWSLMLAADLNADSLRMNLVLLALAVAGAYPVAVWLGYNGVAGLFTILELVRLAWMVQFDRGRLGLGWLRQIRAAGPGLVGGAGAALVLALVQLVWPPSGVFVVVAELGIAVVAYLGFLVAIGEVKPSRLRELLQAIRPSSPAVVPGS